MNDRARITLPDIVYALVCVFFIGALWPVFYDGFEENLGLLSPGEELIYQLVLPLLILVLMTVIWTKTIGGHP